MDEYQGEQLFSKPINPGKTGEDDYRQPRVSPSSALRLFHHLSAQKKGLELRQLVLYVGDFGQHYDGGLKLEDWSEGLKEVCECNTFNRDGHRKSDGWA